LDQSVSNEAAIDRRARRRDLEIAAQLVEDRARAPAGMAPAHLDDPCLDLGCHLVRAPVRLGALVGEGTETVGGVAHEPPVKCAAVDPVPGRGVFDRRSVEHLLDRVVALLNHRQTHQWHGVLLGSGEHK
jgi:hypothetical protein